MVSVKFLARNEIPILFRCNLRLFRQEKLMLLLINYHKQ